MTLADEMREITAQSSEGRVSALLIEIMDNIRDRAERGGNSAEHYITPANLIPAVSNRLKREGFTVSIAPYTDSITIYWLQQ